MSEVDHKYDHGDEEGLFGPSILAVELDLPVNIGRPAHRALAYAGIARLEDLAGMDERVVANLHGVGPKAMRLLRQALHDMGLEFARKDD